MRKRVFRETNELLFDISGLLRWNIPIKNWEMYHIKERIGKALDIKPLNGDEYPSAIRAIAEFVRIHDGPDKSADWIAGAMAAINWMMNLPKKEHKRV